MALIATLGMVVLGPVAQLGLARFRRGRTAGDWYGRGVLLLAVLSGQDATAGTGTRGGERK